jgi:F-type H+-transporting ATPase subunit a
MYPRQSKARVIVFVPVFPAFLCYNVRHMEGIHIALAAEPVFHFLGLPLTGSLLLSWLVITLLIAIGVTVGKNPKLLPGRLQTVFESLFEAILSYMTEMFESATMARRYFPLIVTLFLFIFTANMITFVPGVESVGLQEGGHILGFFRPVNIDLNVTLALAIVVFFTIELSGIFVLGALKYWSKFVTFSSVTGFVIGLIELISNVARLISFSFRLFGNIFAGHVLILVIIFFLPFFIPVPLMLFEVFVGFLQAVIFSLLTLVFIKLAVEEPHAEH